MTPRKLWDGRWGGRIATPPGIVRFWYERKERDDRREDADDGRDWHAGDDGRAVIGPDGELRCYHDDAAGVCARLNAAARATGGDELMEPRASRA